MIIAVSASSLFEPGEREGRDPDTGFQLVKTAGGRLLRIAGLVDDESKRDKVVAVLKCPATNADRDFVDFIIALGKAKESSDRIWCEHALTVGYRARLTEIIQIIGRTTRDEVVKKIKDGTISKYIYDAESSSLV